MYPELIEYCPYCDRESVHYNYNPEEIGYKVRCSECGKQIFLCDACFHADDNPDRYCNWHQSRKSEHYEIGTCFRGCTINRWKGFSNSYVD